MQFKQSSSANHKIFILYAYETVPPGMPWSFFSRMLLRSQTQPLAGPAQLLFSHWRGRLSYYSATGGASSVTIQPLAGQAQFQFSHWRGRLSYYSATGGAAQLLFSHWRGSSVTIQPLAAQSFSVASLSPL